MQSTLHMLRSTMIHLILIITLGVVQISNTAAYAQESNDLQDAEVAAFINQEMPRLMEKHKVPGAIVAVTEGPETVALKGYGFADVEKQIPVDVDTHVFRLASVTKLFTWTSVMQLVDAGQLDLHTDVNDYLDFEIPATFEQPITLWHLLTHTPGLEDTNIGGSAHKVEDIMPLGDAMKATIPERIAAPGTQTGYSNYGTALAGYIVERVSGIPFYEYAEKHVFKPLGMNKTTLHQPAPKHIMDNMVTGYTVEDGEFLPGSYEFMKRYPDGVGISTAADMATFAKMHLGYGAQILSDESRKAMQQRQFGNIPQVAGIGLGFIEGRFSGEPFMGHGGDISLFTSKLFLLPKEDVSVFIAFNTDDIGTLRADFMQRFVDRFFPGQADPAPTFSDQPIMNASDNVEGSFVSSRRNYSTIEKLFWPLMTGVSVSRQDNKNISISFAGEDYRYERKSEGLYVPVEEETDAQLDFGAAIFTESPTTGARNMHFTRFASFRFDETPLTENLSIHAGLLVGSLLCLLVSGLIAVGHLVASKRAKQPIIYSSDMGLTSYRSIILGSAVIALIFVLSMPAILTVEILYGATAMQKMAFWLPVILCAAVAVLALRFKAGVPLWKHSKVMGAAGVLTTTGLVIFLWQLSIWNMIGPFNIPQI